MDNPTFVITLMTFGLVWGLYSRTIDRQTRSAISRLEAKLDLLLKHSGLNYDPNADLPPAWWMPCARAIRSRRSSDTARPRVKA